MKDLEVAKFHQVL